MENKMMNELTYAEVWKKLSTIKCENVDKKGKFTYMSWGVAWLELMKVYPFATYEFLDETYEENGTCMVHCIVKIGSLERYMWLPIMDFNNNSVKNATSRQISDGRMRALVKAIAMFGLGHNIFSNKDSSVYGEDLPDETKDAAEATVVEEIYTYTFTKTGGEVIGADDPLDYLNLIAPSLKQPNNVLHKKCFVENFDAIKFASQYADEATKARYETLISMYKQEPDESSS